ncbi:glycosyltransferase family 2 protein [Lysinibacillus antri]|uniref:Glycosyltransferase family 2 protein n=1 Tax=Lysinibacillus antri TaxID=2498145 RepID=A0A3S0QN13_9BACI|nr:glycosyltransferase family 2 protein [Lysinibacillus antri]RUL47804.1 glycosyltransferase family 2 protein [Lysinibacillus antri]
MEKIAIVMPTLNPLPSLIDYVDNLTNLGIERIIIINDGSDEKYKPIFDKLRNNNQCVIIDHPKNKGKGSALKTGFLYTLKNLSNVRFVLTVGAHGQHKISDVAQIVNHAKLFSDGIILGVRNFNSEEVPFTSSIGNRAASILFNLLFHKRLLDTQTGLRCIPRKDLAWLLKVPGESFSYDTNMLVEAIKRKVPIYEIPIGHMKIKKNTIMFYDEVLNTHKLFKQMITTYTKSKKHHD